MVVAFLDIQRGRAVTHGHNVEIAGKLISQRSVGYHLRNVDHTVARNGDVDAEARGTVVAIAGEARVVDEQGLVEGERTQAQLQRASAGSPMAWQMAASSSLVFTRE